MSADKYVAFDVHKASTYAVVRDHAGQVVTQSVLVTQAQPIGDFLRGLSGTVWLTFEEGTHATWLYDLVEPLVARVIVCDPRKNRRGPSEDKSDRIDAHLLSEWLSQNRLKPVFHDTKSVRRLKHLVRVYSQLVADRARLKNRFRSCFTANAIATPKSGLYAEAKRGAWLEQLPDDGMRRRAELTGRTIDALGPIIEEAKKALCREVRRHPAFPLIDSLPGFGELRSAIFIGTVVTPHRFRRDRQLHKYVGVAVVTHSSSDYEFDARGMHRRVKTTQTRGLTKSYNRALKAVFKGAAVVAIRKSPFKQVFEQLTARGLPDEIARVVVARKLASCALAIWKKGERFDATRIKIE